MTGREASPVRDRLRPLALLFLVVVDAQLLAQRLLRDRPT
jgi:hypothetical protein